MQLTPSSKRIYHPLLSYAFLKNMLSTDQVKLIPKTTLAYWRGTPLESLYGYDWILSIEEEILTKHKTQKHEHFKIKRFIVYLCSFFQNSVPARSFKKYIHNNTSQFLFTFERIYSYTSNIRLTAKIIGVSHNRYYRLKNKFHCTASVLNLCMRTHPTQLSTVEASIIEEAINNPNNANLPIVSIYYKLLNAALLFCGRATFYKYSSLLRNFPPARKPLPLPQGFRSNCILEYLHIDTTFVPTENEGKLRVVFVKDNFSKALLAASSPLNGSSAYIRAALEMAFDNHKLPQNFLTTILSDDGSENKGEVNSWVASFDPSRVIKLTAKLDFPFSNSMVESTNHLFKNVFLKNILIHDRTHLSSLLRDFVYYNNFLRYPGDLYGYSPIEVLNGATPDRNRFKARIHEARKLRVEKNKKDKCIENPKCISIEY